MRRVASWGAMGGAALPLALMPIFSTSIPNPVEQLVETVTVYGLLGAASAAASLHLARRAPSPLASGVLSGDFGPPAT
jgi:hypothetical protein